ncbi:iron chelate uptake ABC transporter family permease subunit [Streptomyces sp. I05A-00742]|uniref:FecCD family ABC transporter permease n=1 Tax=Streptomyces sp. I05A-00742 TaxID=2732853 RepID=UPI00148A09B8|nr:iron chelate uptake ABC transporter family permease subunit [Streptomyces sp. I05A-00742]
MKSRTSRVPVRVPVRGRVVRPGGGLSVRVDPRSLAVCAALTAVALLAALALLGSGDYPLSPADVARTLAGGGSPADEAIVNELRLPRGLAALLVGAALGLAGAVFQSVARNPLGSPDVVGFGQGSATGALCVIVLFHGDTTAVAVGAVAGGLATGLLVYALAWRKGVHGYRLVLVGIGTAAVLTAVNGYLLTEAEFSDAQRAVMWLTGSLDGRGWDDVGPLAAVCAVLLPVVLLYGRRLTMMELGDDASYALGVPVERTRLVLLGTATLLTAAATAAAGPIGFVALSAPQLARRLTRSPGPQLAPAACMGAALLISADWASQRAFGADRLPVGAVTGVLGGAYLVWLLISERRAGRI